MVTIDSDFIRSIRDYLLKFEHNIPTEIKEIRKKFHKEVENSLNEVWTNRKRIVMDIRILQKWLPSHWMTLRKEIECIFLQFGLTIYYHIITCFCKYRLNL